jgi:Second BRCT domain on Nijmegen syndrome breakage protein
MFGDALYSALTAIGDVLDPDSMPDPMEFLPGLDGYSSDLLRPNPVRADLFQGIMFVFLDESQYNNLAGPINNARGKAVLYDIQGKTSEDLVKYATDKGQVLLVQPTGEEGALCIEAAKK